MNNINNGQSAAKPLNNKYGESSTTIETIIDTNNNNGVEYTRNSGNGGNFENNAYVYKHIRLDTNQIFYIGVGTGNNYRRSKDTRDRNKYWKNIVNKTKYSVHIIYDNLSQEEAYSIEYELVKHYGTCSNGGILCNLTEGGRGGMRGHIQSEETKLKRGHSLKGTVFSNARKENISKALKNKPKSEEHIKNLKAALLGRKLSQEHINNLAKGHQKKVVQLKNNKVIKIWNSVKEASLFYNKHQSSISHVCANRKKSCAGYNWKYFQDYDIV